MNIKQAIAFGAALVVMPTLAFLTSYNVMKWLMTALETPEG